VFQHQLIRRSFDSLDTNSDAGNAKACGGDR
jgi:hypothetical protein